MTATRLSTPLSDLSQCQLAMKNISEWAVAGLACERSWKRVRLAQLEYAMELHMLIIGVLGDFGNFHPSGFGEVQSSSDISIEKYFRPRSIPCVYRYFTMRYLCAHSCNKGPHHILLPLHRHRMPLCPQSDTRKQHIILWPSGPVVKQQDRRRQSKSGECAICYGPKTCQRSPKSLLIAPKKPLRRSFQDVRRPTPETEDERQINYMLYSSCLS